MSGVPPQIPDEVLQMRKRLVDVYIRAQRRLAKRLASPALTDFAKFRIQEQLVQINAIIGALNAEIKDALPGLVPAYYKHGADLAGVAMQAQGVKISALNLGSRIHTAAIQAVAEQMALDLAKANTSMKESARRILRQTQQTLVQEKQINKIIAEGLVTGESRRETSARLKEALQTQVGEGKFVQVGKFNYTPEYYAELVTRTRTREAVTQGAVTRSMEFGITLFQVSIHDNPCPQCSQYQGKVYSVTPDSGFPMLEARPPYHPHCRHVLLPYVERPGKEDQHEAIKALSNSKEPITGGLPGYTEAVAQARATGGLRKKQLPGEARTVTPAPPVQTGPTGEFIRKRIVEIAEKTNGSPESIKAELAKLYPGNPSPERTAAPLKFKATGSMSSAVAEAKFNEGVNNFFRMVSESSLPQGAFKPAFHSQKSRRAFYSLERQEVNLQHDNEQKTIIHEMGHWLEHKNPRIAQAANDFLEARTKGEAAQKLSKLTGNRGYKGNEIAKKDNFKHPYTGKIYPKFSEQKLRAHGYPDGAVLRCTEITSMGLEEMFDNPRQFAEDDPDFFDFIWDVIMSGKEYP